MKLYKCDELQQDGWRPSSDDSDHRKPTRGDGFCSWYEHNTTKLAEDLRITIQISATLHHIQKPKTQNPKKQALKEKRNHLATDLHFHSLCPNTTCQNLGVAMCYRRGWSLVSRKVSEIKKKRSGSFGGCVGWFFLFLS